MATDKKDSFIQYLVDKVNTYELDKRATELAVEEFQSSFWQCMCQPRIIEEGNGGGQGRIARGTFEAEEGRGKGKEVKTTVKRR